jgi:hypothetical protein
MHACSARRCVCKCVCWGPRVRMHVPRDDECVSVCWGLRVRMHVSRNSVCVSVCVCINSE